MHRWMIDIAALSANEPALAEVAQPALAGLIALAHPGADQPLRFETGLTRNDAVLRQWSR